MEIWHRNDAIALSRSPLMHLKSKKPKQSTNKKFASRHHKNSSFPRSISLQKCPSSRKGKPGCSFLSQNFPACAAYRWEGSFATVPLGSACERGTMQGGKRPPRRRRREG